MSEEVWTLEDELRRIRKEKEERKEMEKSEIKKEIERYEREFEKWDKWVKEKTKIVMEKIKSFKTGIDTRPPDQIIENGFSFLDLLDFFNFALRETELLRKDLHDYIDNRTSIFEITLRSEWEKRNAEGEKIKITDKGLNREALKNDDLFKLRMIYNKFEALNNYIVRQVGLVQEVINLIKKLGVVRSEYLKSLGEEV